MNIPDFQSSGFSDRLLAWFDTHGRKTLPWQQDKDPYRVWIAEIMLQQTRVSAVIPYFTRFLNRFPTIQSLAESTLDDVMHHWSGLGYYARARNLHKSAILIMSRHNGTFPDALEQVVALPGIGRSTAGAILAFCFHQRQPILDGNVKRVLTRVFGIPGYPGAGETQSRLWQLADQLTPEKAVDQYTQAIMDLGATLCSRSNPLCDQCPLVQGCVASSGGNPTEYPHPKPKKQRPERYVTMLLLQDIQGQVLLIRRPASGIWGGLWSFPELSDNASINQYVQNQLGLTPGKPRKMSPLRHGFTHFDLVIQPQKVPVEASSDMIMDAEQYLWYNPCIPQSIGLPAAVSQLLNALSK